MTNAFLKRGTRTGERGQVLPLAAMCLSVLFGFAAFAVDAGYMRYEQRIEQSAADSAAIAGAAELAYPDGDVAAAAQADAARNGYTNDGSGVIVSVSTPPSSGAYAGNGAAVEVSISVKHPTFFAGIFGMHSDFLTTSAVGLLKPNAGPDCIYVLKPSSTTIVNGAGIDTPTCGMIANGALTVNGSSIDAQSIGVAGKILSNGAHYAEATPAPAVQANDPCPMIAGCAYLQNSPPATSPCNYNGYLSNGGSSVWLSPGVYCGTTIFNGTTNVNFNPGVYVFTGNVTSNGVRSFNGTGVTIELSGSGTFTFNGSQANMTAPVTGNTAGILFYAPNTTTAIVNGGAGNLEGVIYFPKADLTFNGNSNSYYVLVSNTLIQNGAISITGPGNGGSLVREGVLAQ